VHNYYYYNYFTALWTLPGTTRLSQYQKKHSPTHIYLSPQSVSKFFCLPLGLAPSTSHSIYFFTQSLSSFRSTCPYYLNLFWCSTKIMTSNPSLSLNPLLRTLSCTLMLHIHLTILISHLMTADTSHSSTTNSSTCTNSEYKFISIHYSESLIVNHNFSIQFIQSYLHSDLWIKTTTHSRKKYILLYCKVAFVMWLQVSYV